MWRYFLTPQILQALIETTDVHTYNEMIKGNENDTFLKGYVRLYRDEVQIPVSIF